MGRIIGIDLGTTNSCVAVLERGLATVLPSPEGERTTPSVVAFSEGGVAAVIGTPAKRQMVTNAARTIYGTKRLVGRKVNATDVEKFANTAPFRIVAASNGDAWVRLPERDVSPQEVSAYVLERMRQIAEKALGETVTQAVITVPAYFNDAQRQATKDAGRIAGLDVRRILNEPTAAALAYGIHRRKDRQLIAVFDLGGGTFDISILSVERGIFEVLAVSGESALGGDDFDRRVVDHLLHHLQRTHRVDLSTDPVALGRLKEEAERAKKILSDERSIPLHLPYLGRTAGGHAVHLEYTLTREAFDDLTRDLVESVEAPCRAAFADAGILPADLHQVLLVGGMTRVPAVQTRVERIFGRRPSKGAHPDEVVALGAASHAGILAGDMEDVVLLDVVPQSLGIRVGQTIATVIPRNTTVPTRARKVFATTEDDQGFVALEVYQGESKDPKENRHLGRFTLEGLPKGKAGSVRVELSFLVDADGIVSVGARELSTGLQTSAMLSPAGGLDEGQLTEILERRRRT